MTCNIKTYRTDCPHVLSRINMPLSPSAVLPSATAHMSSMLPHTNPYPPRSLRARHRKRRNRRMCWDPLRSSRTPAATSSEAAGPRTQDPQGEASLQSPINQPPRPPAQRTRPSPGVVQVLGKPCMNWAPGSGKHKSHLPVPSEPETPKHLPGAERCFSRVCPAGAPDGRSGSLPTPWSCHGQP